MNNFISALCAVSTIVSVFIGIGALIVGVVGGYFATYLINTKKMARGKQKAVKILEEAYAEAKTVKKEAILEAKEEIHKQRLEFDKEVKDRRLELQRTEDRLSQKEDFIDKKDLNLDKKQEDLENQKKVLDDKLLKVDNELQKQEQIKKDMIEQLEKVASLWAVKEATFKALDISAGEISYKEIELHHKESCKTFIKISGKA